MGKLGQTTWSHDCTYLLGSLISMSQEVYSRLHISVHHQLTTFPHFNKLYKYMPK